MDINIEVRLKQLEHLDQFILTSKNNIKSILDTLNWKEDVVREDNNLVTCSFQTHHKVPKKSIETHLKKCELLSNGYSQNDQFLSEPLNDPVSSVYINDEKKRELFHLQNNSYKSDWNIGKGEPKTADRLLSTFNPSERLALYDFAKDAATGPPILPEFNVLEVPSTYVGLTYEQKLEQERNAKRRRIKYKTVHTSHKNQTEILRDVIQNQMELYTEWLNEKDTPMIIKKEDNIKQTMESPKRNDMKPHNSRENSVHSNYDNKIKSYKHRDKYSSNYSGHKRRSSHKYD